MAVAYRALFFHLGTKLQGLGWASPYSLSGRRGARTIALLAISAAPDKFHECRRRRAIPRNWGFGRAFGPRNWRWRRYRERQPWRDRPRSLYVLRPCSAPVLVLLAREDPRLELSAKAHWVEWPSCRCQCPRCSCFHRFCHPHHRAGEVAGGFRGCQADRQLGMVLHLHPQEALPQRSEGLQPF